MPKADANLPTTNQDAQKRTHAPVSIAAQTDTALMGTATATTAVTHGPPAIVGQLTPAPESIVPAVIITAMIVAAVTAH